jgi:YjbE family integral membrane protein
MLNTLTPALGHAAWTEMAVSLAQVMLIDLVMAGDNTVAVGVAAAGLDKAKRRQVILAGLAAAVVLRIGFALVAAQLLNLIGLLFAGGLLLIWVCWKMWRDLRAQHRARHPDAAVPAKTFAQAFVQILVADISMSLDNVLAVAGVAHDHPAVLAFGLLLSIVLMGVAANAIAGLLEKARWLGYVAVLVVLYVALHMTWDGYRAAVIDLHQVRAHNDFTPDWLDIQPAEIKRRNR